MVRTAFVLLVAGALLVAGCGQRGSLYLRDQPPPGLKPQKPEPPRPVPYPAAPERERDGSDKQ